MARLHITIRGTPLCCHPFVIDEQAHDEAARRKFLPTCGQSTWRGAVRTAELLERHGYEGVAVVDGNCPKYGER